MGDGGGYIAPVIAWRVVPLIASVAWDPALTGLVDVFLRWTNHPSGMFFHIFDSNTTTH